MSNCGPIGWASDDDPIVIELTKLFNKLQEEVIHETPQPAYIQLLIDVIDMVRKHKNKKG